MIMMFGAHKKVISELTQLCIIIMTRQLLYNIIDEYNIFMLCIIVFHHGFWMWLKSFWSFSCVDDIDITHKSQARAENGGE